MMIFLRVTVEKTTDYGSISRQINSNKLDLTWIKRNSCPLIVNPMYPVLYACL